MSQRRHFPSTGGQCAFCACPWHWNGALCVWWHQKRKHSRRAGGL